MSLKRGVKCEGAMTDESGGDSGDKIVVKIPKQISLR